MNISRAWLQTFFESELPPIEQLADALTFHAFEIESIENDLLDVKVTANRGHDCLSHLGIARELSAILDIPLKERQHTLPVSIIAEKSADAVTVSIEDPKLCSRYIAGYIRGAKVGPSPDWLRERLESIGQKSINNVVDAANFVMFDIGQPLHAFDAKLREQEGKIGITVRSAKRGERLITLDDKEQELDESMLLIADSISGEPIGVAGVKGGKESGVSDATTDLILESANFDGPSLRKTARTLKFRTDASSRFEQGLSPELAASGMRAFTELVLQVAGGELAGFVDAYPVQPEKRSVTVSLEKINGTLDAKLGTDEVETVFKRLGLPFRLDGEHFTILVPFERLDIMIAEDLVEEVGRIIGYDQVPSTELPATAEVVPNPNFDRLTAIRGYLREQGFSEVYTSVFADTGERVVANKADGVHPYLRNSLTPSLQEALERNVRNKDLLGISQVKLFEIGTVWDGGEEKTEISIAVEKQKKQKTEEIYRDELQRFIAALAEDPEHPAAALPDTRYEPFSKYPFISRDIAFWTPAGTSEGDALTVIREHAGDLLVKSYLFDRFEKDGRVSFAFRLVFQSMDRTLFDGDADSRMESITNALKVKGWEVR